MSTDDASINVSRDLSKLDRFLKQKKLYAGISNCFENLFELQKYYDNAIHALKNGLISDTNKRIFLYDEVNQDS